MAHALYMTALYTGMRAGELAGLQWADVDFNTRLITVQRSFEGPTKSDEVRRVPIVDALLEPLKRWKVRHPRQAGLHQPRRKHARQERAHFPGDPASRARESRFPKGQRGERERHYIRFHDLRHTFASHWVMNGGDLYKLQAVLGHESAKMTQRYAHLRPDAFKAELGLFGSAA